MQIVNFLHLNACRKRQQQRDGDRERQEQQFRKRGTTIVIHSFITKANIEEKAPRREEKVKKVSKSEEKLFVNSL